MAHARGWGREHQRGPHPLTQFQFQEISPAALMGLVSCIKGHEWSISFPWNDQHNSKMNIDISSKNKLHKCPLNKDTQKRGQLLEMGKENAGRR